MKKHLFIAGVLLVTSISLLRAQSAGDVLKTTQKVNQYFMQKYTDPTLPTIVNKVRTSNLWTRAVYYEGLMALNEIDPNEEYINYVDSWGNYHQWAPRDGVETLNADNQCCAQTYIDRYAQTNNERMIIPIRVNLEKQMEQPRIDFWTWIDAIQMAMPVYAKMAKVTHEPRYMDYAMKLYEWTRNVCGGGLFNTKSGLWWRDANYVPPYKEADGNDCYWSRGNGWVYAALVRVMNELTPNDKYYKSLKKDFLAMTKGIVSCQREDGLWNVSLHSPVTFGGKELTGSALFLYGLCWGINNGILPAKKYRSICDKVWNALNSDCVYENGRLGYVQGTGKEPAAGQPVTYYNLPDFEDFGTGCFLLGATEYYKLVK